MQQPPQYPQQSPYSPYPQQPQYAPPGFTPLQPPKLPKKKFRWPWIVAIIGIMGLIGLLSTEMQQNSIPSKAPTYPTTAAQARAQTSTPQPISTFAATYGKPTLGAALSDFVGRFGQPQPGPGQPYNFLVEQGDTIVISVTLRNGKAIQVAVVAPDSWVYERTLAYCTQFLPSDAVSRGQSTLGTLYDSASVGRFSMIVVGNGACTLNVAS
jgi:hypothetical protein